VVKDIVDVGLFKTTLGDSFHQAKALLDEKGVHAREELDGFGVKFSGWHVVNNASMYRRKRKSRVCCNSDTDDLVIDFVQRLQDAAVFF